MSKTAVTQIDRFESSLSVRARSASEIFMKLENNIQTKRFFSYCSRMLLLIRDRLQQNIQKKKIYINVDSHSMAFKAALQGGALRP